MNKKISIFLTCTIALSSLFFLHSSSQSKTNIYIGVLLALISVVIGVFNLIMKEESNSKKNGYVLILLIGFLFLAVGLIVM